MNVSKVCENTFKLTKNFEGRLFEGMWPIPHGVSVNSFIVKGDKVALIDGVCGWDWEGAPHELYSELEKLGKSIEDVEYVIVNHFEPDHAGWLYTLKQMRKTPVKILCSQIGSQLLEAFYKIPASEATIVKDGDTIDLGQGHVLTFAMIPNVHWPDTMATYDTKTGALFPCDAFGSFGTVGKTYPEFDDDLSEELKEKYWRDTVQYYSNIVAIFTEHAKKAIEKAASIIGVPNIKYICTTHGIVWRKDPGYIIGKYLELISCQKTPKYKEVTVIWGSMYGMTEEGVPVVVRALESKGLKVHVHKVPETPLAYIISSAWTSAGIVLAMPTYENKMYPAMFSVVDELFKKQILDRVAFRFGSFGWSGGAQKELEELVQRHNPGWEFLPQEEFRGRPRQENLDKIYQRGLELADKVLSRIS